MEGLRRDINLLGSESRFERKSTMEKLIAKCKGTFESDEELIAVYKELLRPAMKAMADQMEQIRTLAVALTSLLIERVGDDYLDGLLQMIVTRIGLDPVQEPSEDVRLELMKLATRIIALYPHEIEMRNLMEYYKALLEQCYLDAFPELKKECADCTVKLFEAAPRHFKHVAPILIKSVRLNLTHKHSSVRMKMVKAYDACIMGGADEIINDNRDEIEERSTIYALGIVINDQSDSVRFHMLGSFGKWLTNLYNRSDYHHKLVPLIMLCITDPIPKIRDLATEIIEELGRFHMIDNEDNSSVTTLDKRRITLKDIIWYSEDAYPKMDFDTKSTLPQPDGSKRPSLGARMVVAECVRRFLPDLVKQITDVDWSIPLSKESRRRVAIRTLQSTVRYIENNCVQFMQTILDAMYRTVSDGDKFMMNEARYATELVGKFIAPCHYIPLIVPAELDRKKQEEEQLVIRRGDGDPAARFPTWFSASSPSMRANIVIVFDHLLKGSRELITPGEALSILEALQFEAIIDFDTPELMRALLDLMTDLLGVMEFREMLKIDPFDFKTFCCLLVYQSSPDVDVKLRAQSLIARLSIGVTNSETGIYARHFRAVLSNATSSNVAALENLLANAGPAQGEYSEDILGVFCRRLHEIDYQVDTNTNLKLYVVLNAFLAHADENKVVISPERMLQLLHVVILPHITWNRGTVAIQFRRAAVAAFQSLLAQGHIKRILFSGGEVDAQLLETMSQGLLTCYDTDDANMRLISVRLTRFLLHLPLSAECARDLAAEAVKKLDDARDTIRIATAVTLKDIYNDIASKQTSHDVVVAALSSRSVLKDWVKDALVHMDDSNEDLQVALYEAMVAIAQVDKGLVQENVAQVRSKHRTPMYCDKLLAL